MVYPFKQKGLLRSSLTLNFVLIISILVYELILSFMNSVRKVGTQVPVPLLKILHISDPKLLVSLTQSKDPVKRKKAVEILGGVHHWPGEKHHIVKLINVLYNMVIFQYPCISFMTIQFFSPFYRQEV